ncbi:GNAT family N-acetyltransferase [Microbacterium indicum]|uniref:GNAT family N-acetyltransferase n=1 Tax=Microbacterium indicum TaxID=358100 RepID=UPI0003F5B736|nr:GNAT family N-acetyltransferase [Microbacterium indicum]
MPEAVALSTCRLTLSIPTSDDVDAICDACQDPLIQEYTTVPSPYTRDDARTFVELVDGWWRTGDECTWAVRADGELVGMVGLHRIADGAAELGYWMAAPGRGRGYVTEAAGAVLDFAFGPMRLERVSWRAVVGNTASARVAQKLGFRYEGLIRRGLPGHGVRTDGWLAGLLPGDPREPSAWPVLP